MSSDTGPHIIDRVPFPGGATDSPGECGMALTILRLPQLPPDHLAAFVEEAERSGYRFVRRLVDEWAGGANRFNRPGEALFAAVLGGKVVGGCGLNADPYTCGGRVGRVRHLYVLATHRHSGVGRRLVAAVVAAARGAFDRLRLRAGGCRGNPVLRGLGLPPVRRGTGLHARPAAVRVARRRFV